MKNTHFVITCFMQVIHLSVFAEIMMDCRNKSGNDNYGVGNDMGRAARNGAVGCFIAGFLLGGEGNVRCICASSFGF